MPLWVRQGGAWHAITLPQPKIHTFGGVWSTLRKLWVATQAFDTGTPPQLVTTWTLVQDFTIPQNPPSGLDIETGVGIGPDPHVDVSWTIISNQNLDEFTYKVNVEIWVNGTTLVDSQTVPQSFGSIHSTAVQDLQQAFGRVRYVAPLAGGPSADTATVTVGG